MTDLKCWPRVWRGAWASVLASIALGGCTGKGAPDPVGVEEEQSTRIELGEEAYRSAGIEVAPAGHHAVERELRLTGTLSFDEGRMSRVSAPSPGRITRILAAPGDHARAGAVLAEMESPELASALSAYRTASAEADLRQKEKQRGEVLFEGKAISRADLLQREAESERASAALGEARQRLFLLGLKETDLGSLETSSPAGVPAVVGSIRAPMSGIVVERKATPGQNVVPGEELFVVADLSRLWLVLQIYERDLSSIQKGQAVDVRLTAYPGQSFKGVVDYVGAAVDLHTRTVPTRVVVDNRAGLKAGMYADAVVRVSEPTTGVTVPAAAVVHLNGHEEVFVAQGAREFDRREVKIGRSTEKWAEILSGLSAGERVAVKGTFVLKSEALKGTLTEEE